MVHVPKYNHIFLQCEHGIPTVAIMVSLLWGFEVLCCAYYSVPTYFRYLLKACLGVFRLKCLFYFLLIFQSFEVILSSNAIKYNCQTRMRQMTMNKQSTNNDLTRKCTSQATVC